MKYLTEVQLVGYDRARATLHEQFGPATVDLNTVTQIDGGMYRERTTVSIVGPWKVRPSAKPKKKWWQR